MSSDSTSDMELTPQDILLEAQTAQNEILPPKSLERYMATYNNFMSWRTQRKSKSLSENVFLAYFRELSGKYKPSTLWSIYSMLKSTVRTKNNTNLETYLKLTAFMKRQSDGFRSKKSKTLTADDVEKFINEAEDDIYLLFKVILIFGVTGAMRRQELANMDINDVEFHGEILLVKVPNTKNKVPRTFTINGIFCEIVKKYIDLRVQMQNSSRFFQGYRNGKCVRQNIGVNKIGSIPKSIATFLKLPNPEQYTGHTFRRTSATLLADAGADITTLKRHGGWRSSTVAEGYIEDSVENKKKISDQITNSIKINEIKPRPSTSRETASINIKGRAAATAAAVTATSIR